MRRVTRYALSFLVVVSVTAFPARVAAEPELDGMYLAEGANPDGSPYRGLVEITHRGDSFLLSWVFPQFTGDVAVLKLSSVGFGIVSGQMLAVSYYGAEMAGLIVYEIEDGGHRLAGRWTVAGADGTVYAETLTRLPARAAEPAAAEESPELEPPRPEQPHEAPPARRVPTPRSVRTAGAVEL